MKQRILGIGKISSETYWYILKLFNHSWLWPIEHHTEIMEEQNA